MWSCWLEESFVYLTSWFVYFVHVGKLKVRDLKLGGNGRLFFGIGLMPGEDLVSWSWCGRRW